MSVPIRKLLSRKFNLICLNLAGLLTCVLPTTFPPYLGSGFEVVASISLLFLRLNLQLREQFWSFTRFPFNRTRKHPERTKIHNESNHSV